MTRTGSGTKPRISARRRINAETNARSRWARRLRIPFRLVRQWPRLFTSALVGAGAVLLLPAEWRLSSRLLIGWDIGVALYLILAFRLMAREAVEQIRRRASMQDEGRLSMLVLTCATALASIAAIVIELGSVPGHGTAHQPFDLGLAMVTIFLSWLFTHTMFALHYAHEYYDENGGAGGGLNFPGNEDPDYWDFAYFSFVIGMTCQVSDVAVSCRPIRRTAAAHGIVSFLFNAALLALTVNIAASAF